MQLGNTRYMQYVSAFTGALAVGTASLYLTWSSPVLPKIVAGDSPFGNTTTEQRSWLVASFALGTIPGGLISGWALESFGRRGSLLISGLPMLLPWFVVAFSSSLWVVCVARFISGLAISNGLSALILYNAEIAEKEVRGRVGTVFNILGLAGELIVFCIGPYVSYVALALICSVVPLIFVLVFYFMPESPYYLIKVGRVAEARKSLKILLKDNVTQEELEEQISTIKSNVDEEMARNTTFLEFFLNKEYRKLLILLFGVKTLHQLSGFVAISSYLQTIIQNSQSSVSAEAASMICGIVQFPAVFITAAIVDKVGRKPLMIISSLGCALALTIEGIYFYLQDTIHADVSCLSFLPLSGILFYVVMRPIGIGTLTMILLGELFPANIKGHAMTTASFYNNILSFIVAKSFEPVSQAFGMHTMFILFAAVCVLGALFVYFTLPETKGKTFAQIQEKINRKTKKQYYDIVEKPV